MGKQLSAGVLSEISQISAAAAATVSEESADPSSSISGVFVKLKLDATEALVGSFLYRLVLVYFTCYVVICAVRSCAC